MSAPVGDGKLFGAINSVAEFAGSGAF